MANSSGAARVYKTQGGTGLVFASGSRLLVEQGASVQFNTTLDLASAALILPGSLARGYIPLRPIGAKTTATASGIVPFSTTGVQPKMANPDITSGYLAWTWATANTNPMYFEPVRVPDDLSTAGGLTAHLVASGAVANATNALHLAMRAGTATADVIAGTSGNIALGGAAAETTLAISSGNVPATGFMSFSLYPENAHATGAISLYALGLSYQKKTS